MQSFNQKVVVQKYGGSSVSDIQKIQRVAERIMQTRNAGLGVCVVVSAMGDTTDDLLAMAKQISDAPPRRELDMLLTAGERITMALLSTAIHALGGDAISFTGSQCGIITNDRHSDARIIEVRPYRVQDELERGRVVVIAGYQGVSYKKEVTTLGRGGSDTTAVALAAALGAEWCEICSDVDGVYSADPHIVPTARRLSAVTYEEMQEMAEAGAYVLNAQAVEFAKEKNIAIFARSTAQAPMLEPNKVETNETVIRQFAPRLPGTVAAVVSEKALLVLNANGTPMERLLTFLDQHQISGKQLHVNSSEAPQLHSIAMVISGDNLHQDIAQLQQKLDSTFGKNNVQIEAGYGAVSAVGTGINGTYKNICTGCEVLEKKEIRWQGLATSSFRITWLVPKNQLEPAVKALHQRFVETA